MWHWQESSDFNRFLYLLFIMSDLGQKKSLEKFQLFLVVFSTKQLSFLR